MQHPAQTLAREAKQEFSNIFGGTPTAAAFAPGRVELLGNHTDYNDGFVLLAAIDRGTVVVGRPAEGPLCHLYSINLGRTARFSLARLRHDPKEPWADYAKGVLDELRKSGVEVPAFDAVVLGSIPLGSGLSSSAALEVATALFAKALTHYKMDRVEIAKLCRRAENHFVGVPCGILDQFSSLFGEENSAVFLDCRSYEHVVLPLPRADLDIVIANTLTKHALVDGLYAKRRESCLKAAAFFAGVNPDVEALRDVPAELFETHESKLDEETRKRARHVITENQRVLEARKALRQGDAALYRQCMVGSHESSRDNFENSTPELDCLIDIARELPGFHGGKLSGGGFGGCTVNLVEDRRVAEFERALKDGYAERFGASPEIVRCKPAAGARVLEGTG